MLTRAADGDLIQKKSVITSLFDGLAPAADDAERIREVGRIVDAFCKNYSYAESTDYIANASSKSPAVAAMMLKMEAVSTRRAERLATLQAAIRDMIADPAALKALVREVQVSLVDRLETLLDELNLPEGST